MRQPEMTHCQLVFESHTAPVFCVCNGGAGEVEVIVVTPDITRVKAPETVFHRCAPLLIMILPGKMSVVDELGVIVVIIVNLAGDDL